MDPDIHVSRELFEEIVRQRDLYLTWMLVLVGTVVSLAGLYAAHLRAVIGATKDRADALVAEIKQARADAEAARRLFVSTASAAQQPPNAGDG